MKNIWNIWSIFVLFLILRLVLIVTFPPFTDESLYIRWGQLMVWNPDFRFASILYHSRQPLAFWLFGLGSVAVGNPLVGGRLISLLISITSFFTLFHFMKKSFDEHTALISILLLSISPLAILFQSLALMDGILFSTTFCIIYVLNEYRIREKNLLLLAIGTILGTLLWIKTTALFIILPTLLSMMQISSFASQKIPVGEPCSLKRFRSTQLAKLFFRLASLLLPIFLVTLPIVLLPNFSKILSEPGSFSFTPKELMAFPIGSWIKNITYALYGMMIYFSPIVFFFGLIGIHRYRKEKSLAPLYFLGLTILISMLLGKIFRIRYALYAVAGIIPFAALLLSQPNSILLFNRLKYALCIGSSFFISLILILNPRLFFTLFPEKSAITREREYAYGWTAGYGIKSLIEFIEKTPRSTQKRVVLFTEDSPGNPSDYLLMKYYFDETMILSPVDISLTSLTSLFQKANGSAVFIVARSSRIDQALAPYLAPIQTFSENDPHEFLGLYRLKSP